MKGLLLTMTEPPPAMEEEFNAWYDTEHLPERLSIPGFLRGSRWTAIRGAPRYFAMYEVERLDTLASDAYLERLNKPSAWTSKMMPHYRGMTRGLCSVTGSHGYGMGHVCLQIRFKPEPGAEASLGERLDGEILPGLPSRPGIGSVHLLKGAAAAPMNASRITVRTPVSLPWMPSSIARPAR